MGPLLKIHTVYAAVGFFFFPSYMRTELLNFGDFFFQRKRKKENSRLPCRKIHISQEGDGCFPAKVQLPKKKNDRNQKVSTVTFAYRKTKMCITNFKKLQFEKEQYYSFVKENDLDRSIEHSILDFRGRRKKIMHSAPRSACLLPGTTLRVIF